MNQKVYVQYLGFRSGASVREYTLRVLVTPSSSDMGRYACQEAEAPHPLRTSNQPESRQFTVTIPHEAFPTHRARYQDGPDICFLKLQRELATHGNDSRQTRFCVTDAELEDYRKARTTHERGSHTRKATRNL